MPVRFRLRLPIGIGRPGVAVIDESDAVTDEYAGLDRNTLTNKCVAADFAVITDLCALLNFNKRPDPRIIANLAPVKVHERVYSHVSAELHIGRNALKIRLLVTHLTLSTETRYRHWPVLGFTGKPASLAVLEPLKMAANNFDELMQSIDRDSCWLSNLFCFRKQSASLLLCLQRKNLTLPIA
jgi:hypothetical protein